LQEVDSWVDRLHRNETTTSLFANASITKPEGSDEDSGPKLSFSRAYSLALAPQLIYTDSKLLSSLVNSKTYRQLEFVAMGSWFVYDQGQANDHGEISHSTLQRIPTTREDLVFSDKSIDIRSKRAVMKVLRFLVEVETHEEVWKPFADKPLHQFLTAHFKLPTRLHGLFSALTLSLDHPNDTSTNFALPRIARHLRTIGLFGPGFNSVIPKWGGLSEIAQVACRAGAVGGAVYVLNKGLKDTEQAQAESGGAKPLSVMLSDDDTIKTSWIVGTEENVPAFPPTQSVSTERRMISRSITVLSSTLPSLFPALAEGAPPPAGAVVVFPAGTLAVDSLPVYLIIHSSDTGECPQGQSKSIPNSTFDTSWLA
jgi:RAB protein geranylgeranyltransferase component A